MRNIKPHTVLLAACCCAASVVVTNSSATHAESVYAVVADGITEKEVSSSNLRAVYMGKNAYWKSGKKAYPLMRPATSKAGKAAFKKVLNIVPTRYRHYWTQQKLAGKGQPPREVSDPLTVAKMVASRPGAIGFVLESELPKVKGQAVKLINFD